MIRWRRPSTTTLAISGFVLIGAALRIARHFGWLPLPPNVAPISAMAMVSGIFLPRRLTFVVPLAAMLASDLIIGFYALPVMISVYASFAASNLIALRLRRRLTIRRLIVASLLGSTLFYLVTNAAVWAFQAMYPYSGAGLWQAYLAGLPYFRNTVLGDLAYTGLFVGLAQAVVVYWGRRKVYTVSRIHG